MNTNQLQYFIAVAENKSFTKAAQQFYISQTAVTQQIKALEEQLGVELFTRTKHKVEMTPSGTYFLSESKAILHRLHDAIEQARLISHGVLGLLRIGWINGFEQTALPDWIRKFHAEFPEISMQFHRDNAINLYDMLQKRELDLVFNIRFDADRYKNITYIHIQEFPVLAILPPNHPLADKERLTREDLRGEPFILVRQGDGEIGERQQAIRKYLTDCIDYDQIHYANDIETILLMISAGFGVTFLPIYTLSTVKEYHLKAVPIEGVSVTADIVAAWDKDNDNSSLSIFTNELQKIIYQA
jgi:LysR family transcriptional activator of glutamate synthase operon